MRVKTIATVIFGIAMTVGHVAVFGHPNPLSGYMAKDFDDGSELVGTWHYEGGDSGGQQKIDLELRSDGTYSKTLVAYVRGHRYGGQHEGTWTAQGSMVHLSGDGNWPPYDHDLSLFRKTN